MFNELDTCVPSIIVVVSVPEPETASDPVILTWFDTNLKLPEPLRLLLSLNCIWVFEPFAIFSNWEPSP